MNLTPEQWKMVFSEKGLLGPHVVVRNQPDNGIATAIATFPCTTARPYLFIVTIMARDNTLAASTIQRLRATVDGHPTAPTQIAVAAEFTNTNPAMVNPPVFTVLVNGVNLEVRVNNPVAGNPVDVEVTFDVKIGAVG